MKIIRKTIIIGLMMGYAAVSLGSACPSTNVVSDPQMFLWTHHPVTASNPEAYYSGTMEIGATTIDVDGVPVTTRAYRQAGTQYTIPGPTMGMKPGNKYVLSFKNTLPPSVPSPEHNVFKDPDISNLHTHGLHISGESPGDDVTRSFSGGFGGDFVYDIPVDHMGGTYWYHAHHHGSTMLQVSGGAFGLIIIDDSKDKKIDGNGVESEIPANVRAMVERHLVIAFLDPSVAGVGGDTLLKTELPPSWTVNGKLAGNVCMPPNTWQHLRILLADRVSSIRTLEFTDISRRNPACEVALMSRDGVWRTEVPKALDGSIDITAASRADLAVRCKADTTITVDNEVVANIFVDGTEDPSAHPYDLDGSSTWLSKRPDYLRDLRAIENVNTETINMGARTINGGKFDADIPTMTMNADLVQEWSLKGAQMHPFHLHVYHVQATADCGSFESGEYYDVMAGNCKVRFDLNSQTSNVYEGRTIMHCHILEHEDQGAMGWLNVTNSADFTPIPPPTYPANGDISVIYSENYSF